MAKFANALVVKSFFFSLWEKLYNKLLAKSWGMVKLGTNIWFWCHNYPVCRQIIKLVRYFITEKDCLSSYFFPFYKTFIYEWAYRCIYKWNVILQYIETAFGWKSNTLLTSMKYLDSFKLVKHFCTLLPGI